MLRAVGRRVAGASAAILAGCGRSSGPRPPEATRPGSVLPSSTIVTCGKTARTWQTLAARARGDLLGAATLGAGRTGGEPVGRALGRATARGPAGRRRAHVASPYIGSREDAYTTRGRDTRFHRVAPARGTGCCSYRAAIMASTCCRVPTGANASRDRRAPRRRHRTVGATLGIRSLAVVGAGFEPAKAEPTGLQPVPFDRSGIPPGNAASVAANPRPIQSARIPAD